MPPSGMVSLRFIIVRFFFEEQSAADPVTCFITATRYESMLKSFMDFILLKPTAGSVANIVLYLFDVNLLTFAHFQNGKGSLLLSPVLIYLFFS